MSLKTTLDSVRTRLTNLEAGAYSGIHVSARPNLTAFIASPDISPVNPGEAVLFTDGSVYSLKLGGNQTVQSDYILVQDPTGTFLMNLGSGTGSVVATVNSDGTVSRTGMDFLTSSTWSFTQSPAPTTRLNAALSVRNFYTNVEAIPPPTNTVLGFQPWWSDTFHIGSPTGMVGSFVGGFTIKGWNDSSTGHDIHNVAFNEGDLWINNSQNSDTTWANNWRQAAMFSSLTQGQTDGTVDVVLSIRTGGKLNLIRSTDVNPINWLPAYSRAGIASLPINSVLSQSNEAVTLLDARLNAKGGVTLVGDTGGTPGWGAPVSFTPGEFFVQFVVRPRWDNRGKSILFATSDGTNNVAFAFGAIAGGTDLSQPANLAVYDFTSNVEYLAPTGKSLQQCIDAGLGIVAIHRDASGNYSDYFNGTALTWPATPPARLGPITRMLGGVFGGFGQFQGDVVSGKVLNFMPTASEKASMQKGEASGRMLYAGSNHYSGSNLQLVNGTGSVTSATPTSCTYSNGSGYVGPDLTVTGKPVKAGQIVRIVATITYSGASPLDTAKAVVSFTDPSDGGLFYPTSVVGNVHTWLLPAQASHAAIQPVLVVYGQSGTVASISGYTVDYLGTVADYRPENVTQATNSWIDVYGNDLLPPVGATALNPVQAYRRTSTMQLFGTSVPGLASTSLNELDTTLVPLDDAGKAFNGTSPVAISGMTAGLATNVSIRRTLPTSGGAIVTLVNMNGSDESCGSPQLTVTQTIL